MDIVLKTIIAKVERSSQKEVAAELGVSQQYLSDVVRGRRGVSQETAKKLGFERAWVKVKREEGK